MTDDQTSTEEMQTGKVFPEDSQTGKKRTLILEIAAVLVVIVLGGFWVWWLNGGGVFRSADHSHLSPETLKLFTGAPTTTPPAPLSSETLKSFTGTSTTTKPVQKISPETLKLFTTPKQ